MVSPSLFSCPHPISPKKPSALPSLVPCDGEVSAVHPQGRAGPPGVWGAGVEAANVVGSQDCPKGTEGHSRPKHGREEARSAGSHAKP